MKKFLNNYFTKVVFFAVFAPSLCAMENRETIFDRIEHIEPEFKEVPYLPPLCDEISALTKGFVEVQAGQLYYEEEGQGIPLVLINGGPGGTHHVFHPYFSQIKDFAHIIYYDQRGTGKSSIDNTGKTYTINQAVEDLESLRKALNIEKWAVLGWSYGGFLAQCYALTYPENVIGLILVAAADGLANVEMKQGRGQMFISQAEHDAIHKIYSITAEQEGTLSLAQVLFNKDLCGDWKRQNYYKPSEEEFARTALYEWNPAPGFSSLICSDMCKISLDGKFDDFEIPTLVAEAKWDLTWDTDKTGFMRKNHPHAQFEYFEKSGHCIFSDEPEKFFSLLKNFLEKSSKEQITYKQGNRLVWPEQRLALLRKLLITEALPQKDEREMGILECYEQALRDEVIDADLWGYFVDYFIQSRKDYEKCLTAIQHFELSAKTGPSDVWNKFDYVFMAWRGHMLDLLERRDEAIKSYQEALLASNGRSDDGFGGCMQINKQWLDERLKTPFMWDRVF